MEKLNFLNPHLRNKEILEKFTLYSLKADSKAMDF